MNELHRVILIDPEMQSVTMATSRGMPTQLRELVRATGLDYFRLADHGSSWDYGWVDDLGLQRGKPIHAFKIEGRKDPIAGRCAVVGADKGTGDTVDARLSVLQLRGCISWLGLILPEVAWDTGTKGITRAIITYSRVRA